MRYIDGGLWARGRGVSQRSAGRRWRGWQRQLHTAFLLKHTAACLNDINCMLKQPLVLTGTNAIDGVHKRVHPARHMSTAEVRKYNRDKARRLRSTPQGRHASRVASMKSYHRNKHKAPALKRKGQPLPLWPITEHCELCGSVPKRKALCLDHCHETNRFRGWLCDACNTGLGHFKNNPVLLRRAAYYLETPL